MRIPAFMTTWQDGGLQCTDGWFHGTVPGKGSRTVPFHEAVSEGTVKEARSPAVVVDLDSLGRRYFDEKVMKNMKVRGADIWFMTYIQDADDDGTLEIGRVLSEDCFFGRHDRSILTMKKCRKSLHRLTKAAVI